MKANNPEKACELEVRVNAIDERVTSLEVQVGELRAETRTGFSSLNANIETLSQQITNMDARIIEEKQKWGEVLRNCVRWTVRGLVAVAVYAAGVNVTKSILPTIFN